MLIYSKEDTTSGRAVAIVITADYICDNPSHSARSIWLFQQPNVQVRGEWDRNPLHILPSPRRHNSNLPIIQFTILRILPSGASHHNSPHSSGDRTHGVLTVVTSIYLGFWQLLNVLIASRALEIATREAQWPSWTRCNRFMLWIYHLLP